MVFVIDSVLEPLLTNSIRNASFNQDITAGKLLARWVNFTTLFSMHHISQIKRKYILDRRLSIELVSCIVVCLHCSNFPRTTLYNLGDEGWARIFYNLAKQNQVSEGKKNASSSPSSL